MRDRELAGVEQVVADQAVDEFRNAVAERRRLRLQLRDGAVETVGHRHPPAAQVAQELRLVVPGYAQRHAVGDGVHRQPQAIRDPGTAVHQVAQEHEPSRLGMRDAKTLAVPLDAVAELGEQRFQLVAAAVHVADDVERTRVVASVGPQALTFDDRGVGLGFGTQLEPVAEALASEPLQRPAEQSYMVVYNPRTEIAVRPPGVAILADALRQIEHDGDGEGVELAGQTYELGAVFGTDVGRVHDGETSGGETLSGDEFEQLEGIPGGRLVGGVVADQRPAGVGRDHLGGGEVLGREGRLAGTRRADENHQAVFGNLYAHRRNTPIWVGAPSASSTSPTGSTATV